jgi:5,5'-dehydrodivanillate O-demethylase
VYAAPPGVEASKQDCVPWYEPPRHDENGKPILDYVLAQDALVWDAQGAIADRTTELLGRTDIPIVLLRRQLDEQIRRVEEGLDPINFYRESPDIIYGSGSAPDYSKPLLKHNFRMLYHRGFFNDDADRYGPAIELVKDLHRKIEEFETAQRDALERAERAASDAS